MAQENYSTFDFTPYESNFATGRREELADRTRQEFNQNKAEYDTLKRTIGALETTNVDSKYINTLENDIENTMHGVLETGRYDLANFAVSDSLTRFMTDNNVKNAVESFQTMKKEKQLIAANPSKYKDYNIVPDLIDPETGQPTDDPAVGIAQYDPEGNIVMKDLRDSWDSGVQGAYLGNSEQVLDHQAKAYEIMKSIAKDPRAIQLLEKVYPGLPKDKAEKFLMSGQWLSDEKVFGLAEQLVGLYAGTDEGLQRQKDLSRTINRATSQLFTPEQIRTALIEDLRLAGQTQIGMTQTLTSVPQDRASTKTSVQDRPLDYLSSLESNEVLGEINKNYKQTKKDISAGTSKIYNADGTLKLQQKVATTKKIQRGSKTYTVPDTYEDDPDSFTKAYERAKAQLEAKGSINPLDIDGDYERAVYINAEFGGLKVDKNGTPIAVSDADFTYEVEKALANSKSIQNTIYLPRTDASQKGTDGATQVVQNLSNLLNNKGVLIYDEQLNPDQGLTLDQWDKQMDKELSGFLTWHSEGEAKEYLKKAIANTAKGTSRDTDDPDVSVGLTLRPQSPGATQVSYTDESGNSRVIYIKTGEISQTMLRPAAGLIKLATDPLTPQVQVLPNIYGLLDDEKVAQGIQTFIGNELISTGGTDSDGNPIPFTITPRYYVFEGRLENGKPVPTSKFRTIPQEKINDLISTAIKVYTEGGPDASTPYKDQEDDF